MGTPEIKPIVRRLQSVKAYFGDFTRFYISVLSDFTKKCVAYSAKCVIVTMQTTKGNTMTTPEIHAAQSRNLDRAIRENDHMLIRHLANAIIKSPPSPVYIYTKTGLRKMLSAMKRDPSLNVHDWCCYAA